MSDGFVCECQMTDHPRRLGGEAGCGRYAADQELGGYCSSCASGWHRPCDRPRFTSGPCLKCGWHGSQHGADR